MYNIKLYLNQHINIHFTLVDISVTLSRISKSSAADWNVYRVYTQQSICIINTKLEKLLEPDSDRTHPLTIPFGTTQSMLLFSLVPLFKYKYHLLVML